MLKHCCRFTEHVRPTFTSPDSLPIRPQQSGQVSTERLSTSAKNACQPPSDPPKSLMRWGGHLGGNQKLKSVSPMRTKSARAEVRTSRIAPKQTSQTSENKSPTPDLFSPPNLRKHPQITYSDPDRPVRNKLHWPLENLFARSRFLIGCIFVARPSTVDARVLPTAGEVTPAQW